MLFNISFFQKYERKLFKMIDFDLNCVIMKKKKKQMIDFDVFFILEKEDDLYENYRAVAGCNN